MQKKKRVSKPTKLEFLGPKRQITDMLIKIVTLCRVCQQLINEFVLAVPHLIMNLLFRQVQTTTIFKCYIMGQHHTQGLERVDTVPYACVKMVTNSQLFIDLLAILIVFGLLGHHQANIASVLVHTSCHSILLNWF